jgi:putative tricarboxylic transport membrane protein
MIEALQGVLSLSGSFYLLLGTCIGFVIGIIPGIGQGAAMLLLMPMIFVIPTDKSFILFTSLLGSTTIGGSITSILFNTPGSSGNIATIVDGYPMARRGEAARALGLAAGASMIGGTFGLVILGICIPFARPLVMLVGLAETFWLVVLAFLVIALASPGGAFLKGLVAIFLGLALSASGVSKLFAVHRYTFGTMYLWEGIPIVATIVGLFAISEFVMLQAAGAPISQKETIKTIRTRDVWLSMLEVLRYPKTLLRGSLIGTIVGIIPGIGGSVASILSYGIEKASQKGGIPFGEGNPLGVVAPESANNAKDGGQMVPLLFFGIPGAPEGAILLVLFIIAGISPGPGMALKNVALIYIVILSIFLGNAIACIMVGFGASRLASLTFIPIGAIFAVSVPITFIACFAARGNFWDIAALTLFVFPGVLLKRSGYPVVGVIIGYVLGPLLEVGFFSTLQSGFFTLSGFFQSWISIGLAVTALLLASGILTIPIISRFGARNVNTESASKQKLASTIRYERIGLAAALLFLSVAFMFYSFQYNIQRAGLFPFIVGVCLVALVLVILISESFEGASHILKALLGSFGNLGRLRGETRWIPLLAATAWVCGFIFALVLFGHLVATLFFVFGCLLRTTPLGWKWAAVTSALTTAVVYVVFILGLNTALWPGIMPMIVPKILGGGSIPPL